MTSIDVDGKINITSKRIAELIYDVKKIYENLTIRNSYIAEIDEQKTRELMIISRYQSCPPNINVCGISKHIGNLNVNKLASDISDRFYDPSVTKVIGCISSGLIMDNNPEGINYTERIREYIRNLRSYDVLTAFGIASHGDLNVGPNDSVNDLFCC